MGDQHEYITTQLPGKFILWGGPLILFYPSCHFIDATPSPIQPFLYRPGSEVLHASDLCRIIRDNEDARGTENIDRAITG